MTKTADHLQTNRQPERFNKTTERQLRHYIRKYQGDWITIVQPLKYASRTQMHDTTKKKPVSLVMTRKAQVAIEIARKSEGRCNRKSC